MLSLPINWLFVNEAMVKWQQNNSQSERRQWLMPKKCENIYRRKDGRWEGRLY